MAGNINDSVPLQPSGAAPNWIDPRVASSEGLDSRLASIFQPIYANAKSSLDANYADQLKKLRANQGARGVLQSGVADYPAVDLMKANTNALGGVQSNLANIFGNTEASRSLFNTQADFEKAMADRGYTNSLDLANLIGGLNKPSALQQGLGGVGQFAGTVGSLAKLFA